MFGGPILEPDDVRYDDIQVPDEFWKILVYLDDGAPRAKGFVLKQIVRDIDTERIELPKWAPFEKSVACIARSDITGLRRPRRLGSDGTKRPCRGHSRSRSSTSRRSTGKPRADARRALSRYRSGASMRSSSAVVVCQLRIVIDL